MKFLNESKSAPYYLLLGFLTLVMSSFIDNFRGPLLPIVRDEFQLSYQLSSWFLIIGNVSGAIISFAMVLMIEQLGERRIFLGSALIAMVVVLFSVNVESFIQLLFFAFFMGAIVAIFGATSNLLVLRGAHRYYQSRVIALLHVFYGFGAMLAPVAIVFLKDSFGWRKALWVVIPVLGISIYVAKVMLKEAPSASTNDEKTIPESNRQSSSFSSVHYFMLLTFMLYVGSEVMTSMWMTAFIHQYFEKSIEDASSYLAMFFIVLAGSRFLCFLFLRQKWERALLWLSLVLPLFSLISVFAFQEPLFFIFCGLIGPFFPIFFVSVSNSHPEKWRQMGTMLVCSLHVSLAICHLSMGKLAALYKIENVFPVTILMLLCTMVLVAILEKKGGLFKV